jgi:hypothetical protein
MNCTHCGKDLVEGANFCQYCGTAVKAKPAASESTSGKATSADIHIDVGHNEGQVIGQVTASGDQPVHIGGQQRYGDEVKGNKIDLGGGTYIESADTGGGDLVFGNKIGGDFVQGDKIEGDKITVTGAGAHVQVSHGLDPAELAALFQEVNRQIDRLPERAEIGKDELKDTAGRLEKEIAKGDQANPERLKRWLDVLEKYAPDVVEILVNALLNPGAGAASAVKAALKQFGRQPPAR